MFQGRNNNGHKKKKDHFFKITLEKAKSAVFSLQGLPLVLCFTVIGVLFVLFRMKSVEMDYKLSETQNKIEDANSENKDLKATRAQLLSVNNLRIFAKKYNLSRPDQEQIIIVR